MSEQKFKEAKGNLAFSQQLVDKFHQPQQDTNMAQPQGQMEQPIAPQEQPQSQEQPVDNGVEQAVQKAMEPFLKKIEEIVASKKPQDVSLTIDGTMEPGSE